MAKKESLTVETSSDIRLDLWLKEKYPLFSRNYFQTLLESGNILLNHKPAIKRSLLKKGDALEITFHEPQPLHAIPENLPLDILYEDRHLLIVNKPAGLVVHPAPGHRQGTFANGLLFYLNSSLEGDELSQMDQERPGIVHRIDKETSGLLMAAKTRQAHEALSKLFAQKEIQKHYLAIICGSLDDQTIEAPIGRDPVHRKKMTISPSGKGATSICKTASQGNGLSLLEIEILTGRTHQIRVHLAHKKRPVLGDSLYGNVELNRKWKAERQLLHAQKLSFLHPFTHQKMEIKAPIPQDFLTICQQNCLL